MVQEPVGVQDLVQTIQIPTSPVMVLEGGMVAVGASEEA
jgi:hypothetical protein